MRSIVLRVIQITLICTGLMLFVVAYLALCDRQYIGAVFGVIAGMICIEDFLPRIV